MATPTSALGFQNFFSTTLTSGINATDVSIPLDTVPNSNQGFLVIDPDSSANREVIFYTSKTGSTVECASAGDGRGQDDTSASAHSAGVTVIMASVAGYFEALQSGDAIEDAGITTDKISNPYKFSVYRNAAANTGNNAFAKISFDTELYDTNTNFASGTYTVPVNGYYHFDAGFNATTTSTSQTILISLYVNGSEARRGSRSVTQASGAVAGVILSCDLFCTAGDTIDVCAYGTVALALEVAAPGQPYFMGHLIARS